MPRSHASTNFGAAAPSPRENRAARRADFLRAAGWSGAAAAPLAGDASTRSYERLVFGARRAILMNAPPGAEQAACAADDAEAARKAKGYNALARLAGPNLNAFLSIAEMLRRADLSAPEIFHADPSSGFALIEDLGDALFARAIPEGAHEPTLYAAAIDALLQLRETAPAPAASDQYTMLTYDALAMETEAKLLAEWYLPWKTGDNLCPDAMTEYAAAWRATIRALPKPSLVVMRDFHAENLLWLPERQAHRRVGVIDFQDGLVGHPAYDLVSLLEDARRDVAPELADAMLERYAARAGADFDRHAFADEYAVLAGQRNAKILGIFARLIVRDGKPRYADFMPRVEAHFRRDIARAPLAPVNAFLTKHFPDLFT